MRLRRNFLLCISVGAFWCAASTAQADQTEDDAAIRQAVANYTAAFNGGDAKALAALWSPDAVYTNRFSGEEVVGREAIEQQFAGIFASAQGAKLEATTHVIQFISPGVAVERGTAKVTIPDQPSEESEYTAIYVKRESEWFIDRVTEEDKLAATSQYEHLKELEWLIGTWLDQDDVNRIESTYVWTKDKNFIVCFFSVAVRDRIDMAGMQIIGWDPTVKQIRSWVFDSGGGFGEGKWTKKGDRWYVESLGFLADGKKSSSLNVVSYVDGNTFTWQSLGRQVGDELLPNVDAFVVARQPDSE